MVNHWWWRPGWSAGRRYLTWHLTFAEAGDLHRLADEYRRALAGVPGLDLVPDRWLHLTMQGLGFADELDRAEVGAIVDAATARLVRVGAFELRVGTAVVVPEGILMHAEPAERVREVRSAIRAAIAGVRPAVLRDEESAESFRPHVSVAYSNSDRRAAPAIAAVASVSGGPALIWVASAQLILLGRDERMYTWEPFATAELG